MEKRKHDLLRTCKSDFFWLVILQIIGILIALALVSCSPRNITSLTVAPSMPPMPIPAVTKDLEENKIEESLIMSKWQRTISQDSNFPPEVITWEFYSNSMFRWQLTSDFSEERTGTWDLSLLSEGNSVVFLANTTNIPTRFDVLSLKFENERLILGEFAYEKTPFTGTETPPTIIEEDLQAVTNRRDHFFSFWTTITAANWQSESTPPPGDANLYSFMQDGTYTALFNSTQCQYSGTWSISSSGEANTLIWLSVPTNTCDPRGAQDAFIREIPIRLEGDNLILYVTIYVAIMKNR